MKMFFVKLHFKKQAKIEGWTGTKTFSKSFKLTGPGLVASILTLDTGVSIN